MPTGFLRYPPDSSAEDRDGCADFLGYESLNRRSVLETLEFISVLLNGVERLEIARLGLTLKDRFHNLKRFFCLRYRTKVYFRSLYRTYKVKRLSFEHIVALGFS